MNYEESVNYLQSLKRFGIKLGNDRFRELIKHQGDPHKKYKIAHIAGTKGKGSTTVMIASILMEHGFKTGGYYSPYVFDLCERVQMNGEKISRDDFARLSTCIRENIEIVQKDGYGQTTEFEMKTAIGFSYFAECRADYAAVEVGIGGRLDATNIVSPDVCVITNIGLDHTHILGDTLAKIASEKAGIIKENIPIITAAQAAEAYDVIARIAHDHSAPFTTVCMEGETIGGVPPNVKVIPHSGKFAIHTQQREYPDLVCGLPGSIQLLNAGCAAAAVEALAIRNHWNINPDAVKEGLRKAWLPGRMQTVHTRPLTILDGAHNQMAASVLAEEIHKIPYQKLFLVTGMVSGHAPDTVLSELAPLAYKIFATQPGWIRSIPAEEMQQTALKYCDRVSVVVPPLEAVLEAIQEAEADDLVIVTGSFYTIGEVPPELLAHKLSILKRK
jgi:dihydrofolate synthase/folylpolyglutamate synthase